jgi:hypothetical protein
MFKLDSGGLQKPFNRNLNSTSSITRPQEVIKSQQKNKRRLRKKEMRREMKIKEIRLKSLLHNYLHRFSKEVSLTMDNYLDLNASEDELTNDQRSDLDQENGD